MHTNYKHTAQKCFYKINFKRWNNSQICVSAWKRSMLIFLVSSMYIESQQKCSAVVLLIKKNRMSGSSRNMCRSR